MYLSGLERDGISELSAQGVLQIEDAASDGQVHACTEPEGCIEAVGVVHLLLIRAAVEEQVGKTKIRRGNSEKKCTFAPVFKT